MNCLKMATEDNNIPMTERTSLSVEQSKKTEPNDVHVSELTSEDDEHTGLPDKEKKNTIDLIGWLISVVQAIAMATSVAFAQGLDGFVPDWELNSIRYGLALVTSSAVAFPRCSLRQFEWTRKRVMEVVVINVIGCMYNFGAYSSAASLPLGTHSGMMCTLVIIMTAAVTFILHRKFQLTTLLAAVLCTTGLVLVTQPTWMGFTTHTVPRDTAFISSCAVNSTINISSVLHYPSHSTTRGYLLVALAALSGSVGWYIIYNALEEASMDDCFVFILMASFPPLLVSIIIMFATESPMIPQSRDCWLFLIGHSASATLIGWTEYLTLKRITPLVQSITVCLSVAIVVILQYTVLRHLQPGHRNWIEVLGLVLIIGGSISAPLLQHLMSWYQNRMNNGYKSFQ